MSRRSAVVVHVPGAGIDGGAKTSALAFPFVQIRCRSAFIGTANVAYAAHLMREGGAEGRPGDESCEDAPAPIDDNEWPFLHDKSPSM
jgi:hypothetical protein